MWLVLYKRCLVFHPKSLILNQFPIPKIYTRIFPFLCQVVSSVPRPKGLYPNYMNPKTGKWGQAHTSMGALGDSFYEYLLKEWIRSGKRDMQVSTLLATNSSCLCHETQQHNTQSIFLILTCATAVECRERYFPHSVTSSCKKISC